MSNAFPQDDYFKIDPECHLIGDMGPINHFPGVQMWWRAIDNIRRPLTGCPPKMLDRAAQALGMEAWEMEKNADPGNIIRAMDKYGMDIACLLPESMMDSTGYTSRWVTNGEMARVVESNPDRFLGHNAICLDFLHRAFGVADQGLNRQHGPSLLNLRGP